MISVQKVREAQELLTNALKQLREETVTKVEEAQPIEGVKLLKSNMAVVSFSTIVQNGWAPSTYLPFCQIEAIEKATKNISTFDAFLKKITEMVEKKAVKVGNETVWLNAKTVEALESVLVEINS